MKSLLTVIVLVLSQSVLASESTCLAEAQIIAKVRAISAINKLSCVVNIDANSIVQYNVNQTCPLDFTEVLEKGVSVGLSNGRDCALSVGDNISGVIVKTIYGTLELE